MILASSQVSAAAQWLRDLAATLSTQEVAVGTIDAAVAAAIDDLHDHWGGPIPRTVSGCLRSYHAVVGATPEAMFAARVLLMLWAGFADTLAAELAQAESTIARVESVRGTEAEAPGDHDDELSAISRRNSCSEQWTSACVRFSAGLEPTVNALAGAAECWAVEASMVYPSGAAYTRTLCELAVSSGVRIEELDPNGEWDESSADILALLEHDDEWGAGTFTIIESANQEDVSKADGNWSMEDLEAACDPVVVEGLLRRAAAESGEPIDEAMLAARVDEITTVAWLVRARAVGSDDWENIDDEAEWHERGIPRIFRDYVAAPLAQALVTGGCWAAAGLTAPETGGATIVAGAAGCAVIGGAVGRGVQSATHGGDVEDVLLAATDADAMLWDAELGAATGIVTALIPNPATPLPMGSGSAGSRPPSQMLMNQLEASGTNFTRGSVLAIGRTEAGNIVWLETGTSRSGLAHIVGEHSDDFARVGIAVDDLPTVVMEAVTRGEVVGMQTATRPIYEITWNGQPVRVAVTVGDNGFIVGANPGGGG